MKRLALLWVVLAVLAAVVATGCYKKSEPQTASETSPDGAADATVIEEHQEWNENQNYGGQTGGGASGSRGKTTGGGTAEKTPAPPAPGEAHSGANTGSAGAPASGEAASGAESSAAASAAMVTLPSGKRLKIDLDDRLSTTTNKVGDRFTATVSKAIHLAEGSVVAVEKGAKVEGSIVQVEPAKRTGGIAKLGLKFEYLVLDDGTKVPITASLVSEAESTKKRDAATIAGGAAAGAILGKIIGKDGKDALIGAMAGAAVGTGVVLGTKNKEVDLAAGTALVLQLEEPVRVRART